jgi:proton glutamate symport protein
MRKIQLHTQILIGLGLGILFAMLSIHQAWPASWTVQYIKPFGRLFLNSLNMIAIPLVFASLIVGITSIKDVAKFSRIGGKAFSLYAITTAVAAVIGLLVTNIIQPGSVLSSQARTTLVQLYAGQAEERTVALHNINQEGPLQFLVNLVPDNILYAFSSNFHLLQVVVVAILFGLALLKVPAHKSSPVVLFFAGLNEAILALMRYIMKFSPIGVFSLVASLLVEVGSHNHAGDMVEILYTLLWYVGTVVIGLAVVMFIIYPILMRFFTKQSYLTFLKEMRPAQLVAFTTSSSSAALSITMEQVEKRLGISEEISNFVLPLGAIVNMNGTAVYQSVAIVFIAQALGMKLNVETQLIIIANVAISSIGVAGVPGGAMVMTTMILHAIGIPGIGLALILAPDRILDMCRTVVNITGDAVVAVIVASSESKLGELKAKQG